MVYALTTSYVDTIYNFLEDIYPGQVARYHAKIQPEKLKRQMEMDFLQGKTKIMVATSAFGMGIDVPDIELVLHFNTPVSMTDYIQQIGRAGRDGRKARCILFYDQHGDDQKIVHSLRKKAAQTSKKAADTLKAHYQQMQDPVRHRLHAQCSLALSGTRRADHLQMLYQLRQREKGALNMKHNDGIHTFSLKTRSSYSEIQNIRVQNACIHGKHDRFSLNQNFCIADYKDKGVEILLRQSLVHPSWVTLIVNPSSLLADEYQPTELFRPTEQTMKQLKTRLRAILDEIGLDTRPKAFRLARCDLTRDRYYDSADEIALWLGIFPKS